MRVDEVGVASDYKEGEARIHVFFMNEGLAR